MPRNLRMKYYLAGIILILADQISKIIIRATLKVGESISVIGDIFSISHIENSGAAFSMLSGERILLIAMPAVVVVCALIYLHRKKNCHWSLYVAGMLLISGGIGNLIDRALFGHVTDMLDFSFFPPVFNIADIGVTMGCVFLLFYVIFGESKEKKNKE